MQQTRRFLNTQSFAAMLAAAALLSACAGPPPRVSTLRFADDFHLFAVEWDKQTIRWSVDGDVYGETPTPTAEGFHKPFFMLLNLAVGGDWPGRPDETTVFPQSMLVDYVRVYAGAPGKWKLTWGDEFNTANGSAPDKTKWVHDIGGSGWGNNELEFYTPDIQNAHTENGNLVITAIKDAQTSEGRRRFASARLKTKGLFSQAYGRFEARIKVPQGEGMWPAFWMLGESFPDTDWPFCGEIDIMENIGREPSTVHGTIHGPGFSGGNGISKTYSLP